MKKTAFLLALFISLQINAQPFICNGDFYLSLGNNNSPSVFYNLEIDPLTNQAIFNSLSAANAGLRINAIGYRPSDNYIYGMQPGTTNLCRVDASGTASVVAVLDELGNGVGYYAGDISQDGKYMYLLATRGVPYVTRQAARVDLDDYTAVTYPIPDAEIVKVICSDFSIDPFDGSIYAFDDKKNRLIKFDPNLGGDFEETLYPASEVADAIGATFFDAFGNLYGYGKPTGSDLSEALFKIDKTTGLLTLEAFGPEAKSTDGCSCPYTVKLQKTVYPQVAVSCSEVFYVFKIANNSAWELDGQRFLDVMPDLLTITEIVHNPFGGNIINGIGGHILNIEDMILPRGIDSLVVKAEIAPNSAGIYKNQAMLTELPDELGGYTISDDPNTLRIGDSTTLEVIPLGVDFGNTSAVVCDEGLLELVTNPGGNLSFEWSTGSDSASTWVSASGWYWVKIMSDCEIAMDSIYVSNESLDLDLGPDLEVALGDSILIQPVNNNLVNMSWEDPPGNSLSCLNCLQTYARPLFDVIYTATAENEYGCQGKDSIFVKVNKDRKIFIPNVFSPNFVGQNDIFYVQGKGSALIKNFKIFNRWGALVFESADIPINRPDLGWDGRFKGNDLENGVYVYFVDIQFLDGETERFQGDITLMR